MSLRTNLYAALALTSVLAACGNSAPKSTSGAQVISGAAATADGLKAKVDLYKQVLGSDNGGDPASKLSGFRTINWDGVPDAQAAPAYLPADFFNAPTASRARGAVLNTDGAGVRCASHPAAPSRMMAPSGNSSRKRDGIAACQLP